MGSSLRRDGVKLFDHCQYGHYFQIVDYLRVLAKQYPDLVQMLNITKTYEGRDLMGIKVCHLV